MQLRARSAFAVSLLVLAMASRSHAAGDDASLAPVGLRPADSPCPVAIELSPACQPGSRCEALLAEACRSSDFDYKSAEGGRAAGALPAAASWQGAAVGGLAGFVADRARAEVMAWVQDLLTDKLCGLRYTELDPATGLERDGAPPTRWFARTCVLLEDPEYRRQVGTRVLAVAVRHDLARLPRALLHHWLGGRGAAHAFSNRRLLVAYELVWSGLTEARSGTPPLEIVAGLGRNEALIALCRAQNAPGAAAAEQHPLAPECLLVMTGLFVEVFGEPVLAAGKDGRLASPDAVLAQVLRMPALACRVARVFDEARGGAACDALREAVGAVDTLARQLAAVVAQVKAYRAQLGALIDAIGELAPTLGAAARKPLQDALAQAQRARDAADAFVGAPLAESPARLVALARAAAALADKLAALPAAQAQALAAVRPALPAELAGLDLQKVVDGLGGARQAITGAFQALVARIPAAWRGLLDLDALLAADAGASATAAKARLVRFLRAMKRLDARVKRLADRAGAPGAEQARELLAALEDLLDAGFALVPEDAPQDVKDGARDGLETARALIDLAGDVLLEDHERAAARVVELSARLGIPLPAAARRYLAFVVDVATADDSGDVQRAFESVAAPVGGWRMKRERLTLSVTAFAGAMAGLEYPDTSPLAAGSSAQVGGGWAAGLFAPVGIDLSWPAGRHAGYVGNVLTLTPPGWTHGFFLSILDVGQLTWARLSGVSAQDGNPDIASGTDFTQVFSPGLYYHVSLGNSPFTIAVGASYAPALRRYRIGAGDPMDPADDVVAPLSTLRLGVSLSVDVTILPIWVRSGD